MMSENSTTPPSNSREPLLPAGPLRLNLGCGPIRVPGYLGVDIGDSEAVDFRMDVVEFIKALPDSKVEAVYSRHFFEHVTPDGLRELLQELDRVLLPGGTLHIIVPHFSNPYFASDPTHRLPFGVHSFSYLCESNCLHREVPNYAAIRGWDLYDLKVGFRPYERPKLFGMRLPVLSDVLNRTLNRRKVAIEVFERYLSGVLSIYEIEFMVRKRAS